MVWLVINQYFFCPQFSFETPHPFSGNSFYNPYDSMNESHWVKCNFHAHTNAWNGLANGKGTAADIYQVYDSLQYPVHCISDYQKINTDFINKPGYIPAYEHGYNITKTHQLVLGSTKVTWLEYLFPQTLNNKQNILNHLSADSNNVITINHPGDHYGYAASDFKYLVNYNCIEVLSRFAFSFAHWDSALSNGHPAFITGNDDVHDVFLRETEGVMCTWVNSPAVNAVAVLNALKKGRSYGMIIGKTENVLPELKSFKLTNDTISIVMSAKARQIRFIGQNGKTLASCPDTASSKYIIKSEDHYIRTTIEYDGGLKIFLNPVFRQNKDSIVRRVVQTNDIKTFIFRIIGIVLLAGWLFKAFLFSLSGINRQKIRKRLHLAIRNQSK
jgi:hypothetical protein